MTARPSIDTAWFRRVVQEATGTDPGELEGVEKLGTIGLVGVDRLVVLASVEALLDIQFPHDLEPVLETVADVIYYARVKVDQAVSETMWQ